MKVHSFSRSALSVAAVLFVVFSLHNHLTTLVDESASIRSASVTEIDFQGLGYGSGTSTHYLRSISSKEDTLIEKIEQMGAQLAELKELNKLQTEANTEQSLGAKPFPALAPALASTASSSTPGDDPCQKLRASTSSFAILASYAGACKHRSVSELERPIKPLSIATVIPGLAREKDLKFFPKVLKSLEAQTIPSEEVVIAISGVYDRLGIRYKHKLHSDFSESDSKRAAKFCDSALRDFKQHYNKGVIKVICIGERLSSGRARNAAITASSSDILAFIDSDDTAYPIRNEVITNIFNDTMDCRQQERRLPLELLLHSHKRNEKKQHPYEKARKYHLPPTSKVLPGNQWTGEQCLEQEEGLELRHGKELLTSMAGRPTAWSIHGDIANGHPVIRRSIFDKVHFSSIPKGQDIILLRDLMYTMGPEEAEQAVLFINRPLTTYYAAGNANADLRNSKAEAKEKELKRGATGGSASKTTKDEGETKTITGVESQGKQVEKEVTKKIAGKTKN